MIEPLCHIPRTAGFLGLGLQIPTCQIDSDCIAENHRRSIRGMNVCAAFVQSDDQLYLVVQV